MCHCCCLMHGFPAQTECVIGSYSYAEIGKDAELHTLGPLCILMINNGATVTVLIQTTGISQLDIMYTSVKEFIFRLVYCTLVCRCIGLFKMFSRWFFANKKLIIMLRTWKFGDVT